ncbi:hypothetical protein [Thermithiobacillus plumbiphilus]|uniref:DUF2993 domain-containing protein n=1 Tax=Thermithiobacillus plumbiphilus TaxID=1729899 RepID=A0ABU9D748_9PROT
MLDSMFGNIKSKLKQAVGNYVENRSWPVPESAVNLALEVYLTQIPEIKGVQVKVLEGSFEVYATVRKGVVALQSCSTFVVESCEISSERQILTLRQTGKTSTAGERLHDRIVLAVVQALFAVVLRIDPAAYLLKNQPGISVSGDLYTIDLAQTPISNYVREQTALLKMVNGLVINRINCEPGRFLVQAKVRAADADAAEVDLLKV